MPPQQFTMVPTILIVSGFNKITTNKNLTFHWKVNSGKGVGAQVSPATEKEEQKTASEEHSPQECKGRGAGLQVL